MDKKLFVKNTKMKIKFYLLISSIIIAFVILEITIKQFFLIPVFYKINIESHPNGTYMLSLNPSLIYKPSPGIGEFNESGYRGNLHPLKKKSGKKRIIMVGDSVVNGLGVKTEERFTDLLNNDKNFNYEIINLGVCGYNLVQEFEFFKEKGLQYNPDYVIFGLTYTDLNTYSGQINCLKEKINAMQSRKFFEYYYSQKQKLENLLLRSNLYRYFKYVLFYGQNGEYSMKHKISPQQAGQIISSMQDLGRNYNFKFRVILLPTRSSNHRMGEIEKVILKENIPYLDISEIFNDNYPDNFKKELFIDYEHFNKKGNEFMADFLFKNLDILLAS